MQTRRAKKYQPRKVDAGAVLSILLKTQLIDPETCDKKEVQLRTALEALRTGEAYDEHIDVLCDAVNITAKRCESGDAPEAFDKAQSASEALVAVMDRANRVGKWGASGSELTAITVAVDYYLAVMRVSTHKEMREATRQVNAIYASENKKRPKANHVSTTR